MSLNLFIASGNLGSDIDVRFTPNGKCIGQFSLPVTSGWGEHEKTSWVRCKILGDRAEKLAPYLKKGSMITVNGRFEMEEWEKDGVKHSMACILINDLVLPPKTEASQNNQNSAKTSQSRPNAQLTQEEIEALNDDVPF